MGEAKVKMRTRAERMEFRKTIPIRLCKFIVGVAFSPLWMMLALGTMCWEDNKWPWN